MDIENIDKIVRPKTNAHTAQMDRRKTKASHTLMPLSSPYAKGKFRRVTMNFTP